MPLFALLCSEVAFPKKARGVISASTCLRSQLDAASRHLPSICDIWQVHKLPLVSAPDTILGFIRGCGGNRVDILSEGISVNGFLEMKMVDVRDTLSWFQQVSKNSDCCL